MIMKILASIDKNFPAALIFVLVGEEGRTRGERDSCA